MRFKRHVFICINRRPPDHPKGSCANSGSEEIADVFKEECSRRGLKRVVRVNKSQCLDACEYGPSIVVYPEGVWYSKVQKKDVIEIIESHILGGKPVARLLNKNFNMEAVHPDYLFDPIEITAEK
jgi:(2Fe-2S) ferredoxin